MKNKQQTDERNNTPSTPVTEKQTTKKSTEKKRIFGGLRTKKTPTAEEVNLARFNADANEGLSKAQVAERTEKGLVNKTGNIPKPIKAFLSEIFVPFSTCFACSQA